MQQQGKRWPTEIRLAKKATPGGGGGSASASELEEMKRKQRKLLQLVDKYEQLSSLHLTAMAKVCGVFFPLFFCASLWVPERRRRVRVATSRAAPREASQGCVRARVASGEFFFFC